MVDGLRGKRPIGWGRAGREEGDRVGGFLRGKREIGWGAG